MSTFHLSVHVNGRTSIHNVFTSTIEYMYLQIDQKHSKHQKSSIWKKKKVEGYFCKNKDMISMDTRHDEDKQV